MNLDWVAFELARMRQEELIAETALRRAIRRHRPSIRRTIGRRVIAVGQRIAAEPSMELARSR